MISMGIGNRDGSVDVSSKLALNHVSEEGSSESLEALESSYDPQSKHLMDILVGLGVHWGRRKKYMHPSMAPYILGERNGIHILDLEHTVVQLRRALRFARTCVGPTETCPQGGNILFVGSQNSGAIAEASALECGQPYVNGRWIGGLLTNGPEVWRHNAPHNLPSTVSEDLQLDLVSGGEPGSVEAGRALFERHGPHALLVFNVSTMGNAIREAGRRGIPVIGIVDSHCDVRGIDYPIVGNSESYDALYLYGRLFAQAIAQRIESL